jgi:hypothetical protein
MKLLVVTDTKGEIIGTARIEKGEVSAKGKSTDAPSIAGFTALPGQKVFEIEVPNELQRVEDVEEFHKAVKKHFRQSQIKKQR